MADPVAVFLDDHDSSLDELVIDPRKHGQKGGDTFPSGVANTPQEKHARAGRSRQRQDRAEVSVGRDENALLRKRKCHDLVVGAARETQRPDVAGVVAFISQAICHGILECLVDQESHAD